MSTTIYNAYRLKTSKSKEVEAVNEKIRELFQTYQKEQIHMTAAHSFEQYQIDYLSGDNESKKGFEKNFNDYLNYYLFMSSEKELNFLIQNLAGPYGNKMNFAYLYGSMLELVTKYDLGLNCNPTVFVYFKTLGNHTYYMLWSRESDMLNKFSKEIGKISDKLERYDYWNNVDPPEDINYASWKRRGKVWDQIFNVYSTPRECMNMIQIVPLFYQDFKLENIINYLSDDYNLLKKFYRTQTIDILCESEKLKEIEINGKCSDMQAVRLGERKIRENIENGHFLTYKDDMIKRGYDRDSLIQKLLTDAIVFKTTTVE